ncbi:unnamed protein product [Cochlearia groenlandica]
MSKMRSSLKPPLPKSPIRLRSRQVLHNTNTSCLKTPQGYRNPIEPKIPFDYSTISSEIDALAKKVKEEFAKEEEKKKKMNLEDLASDSAPTFERGRFYEVYSAKRNEKLRKKKGEGNSHNNNNLGVIHEPMTNKRRGSVKTTKKVVSMVETTPRYSLRSMMKENKKPPLIPMNIDLMSGFKSVVSTRRGRRI